MSIANLTMSADLRVCSRRDIAPVVSYAVLDAINVVSVVVFTLEFVVQSIHLGLVLGKKSYLRSPWNAVDFAVLVFSIMDFLIGNTKHARILRITRSHALHSCASQP
jgi:hypothetical protein